MSEKEEIKIGEYIRYNDGTIIKVIEEEHSYYNYLFKNKKGIFKHSPKIIDLIEEGDYVNGEKVLHIDECLYEGEKVIITELNHRIFDNMIDDIVTKEQFEHGKYVMEG